MAIVRNQSVWMRLRGRLIELMNKKTKNSGNIQECSIGHALTAEALKGKGLVVEKIDLTPFRALADKVYADSDLAKAWDAAKLKQIIEMK